MYKEKEKYDLQKMKTKSTEILHIEGEIGKEQIRIVLVYTKTGNDNETKDHNKKNNKKNMRNTQGGKYNKKQQ